MSFKSYNCIVVYNKSFDKVLLCKRKKDPYKGLYNFVGGKKEERETSIESAYRELYEETGINKKQISLIRFMDLKYYTYDLILEIFVGRLNEDVDLVEELNPLKWFSINSDFTDLRNFAGKNNLAHIIALSRELNL